MNNLNNIKADIDKYKDYDFSKSVSERLNNTLIRYIEELEKAYNRLGYLKPTQTIKELGKQ